MLAALCVIALCALAACRGERTCKPGPYALIDRHVDVTVSDEHMGREKIVRVELDSAAVCQ